MPTMNELLAVLAEQEAAADGSERVRARVEARVEAAVAAPSGTHRHAVTRTHRASRLRLFATVAAVAATVVGVGFVTDQLRSHEHPARTRVAGHPSVTPRPATITHSAPAHPAPATPRPPVGTPTPTTPLFSVVTSTGARLEVLSVKGWGEQTGRFSYPHGGTTLGIVDANLPGAVQPTLQGFQPVTVDGRPGFYRLGLVQWQYAPNAWISVTSESEAPYSTPDPVESPQLRRQTLKLAGMIRTGGTAPFLVDFKIGWLPPKLVVETAQTIRPDSIDNRTQSTIGIGPGGYRSPDDSTLDPTDGRSLSIYRQNGKDHDGAANARINGRPAYVAADVIQIFLTDGTALTVQANSPTVSAAQLRRIADSVTFGPTLDPDTWIPISQAMP